MHDLVVVAENQDVPDRKGHCRHKENAPLIKDDGERIGHGQQVGDDHGQIDDHDQRGAADGQSFSVVLAKQLHQAAPGLVADAGGDGEDRQEKRHAQRHHPQQRVSVGRAGYGGGQHERRIHVRRAGHDARAQPRHMLAKPQRHAFHHRRPAQQFAAVFRRSLAARDAFKGR